MSVRDPTNNDNQRSYNWCAICYPETSFNDWKKRLESLHIKAVVSPLHHPDSNPESPLELKEHYHVMFMYDSLKSRVQARKNFTFVFGAGFTKYIVAPESKTGMLKYFCHLRNPEKERLNPADVLTFEDVDYLGEIAEEKSSLYILMDITEWIHTNHCCSFIKFLMYCQYNNLEWYRIASQKSTLFVKTVIDSERNILKDIEEEQKHGYYDKPCDQ